MSEEVLINYSPQETRVAVTQQGVVQELHIERTASRGLVGNVYLGRVCRILPGMQSAFIDVGLERTAFLHVADIWQAREAATERPIERVLAEGQSIVVQVVKDPIGTKGARLSTQISIAGRMLVYLPQEKHIGISQRIEAEAEREALRERITHLVPADEPGGFIVRTMAGNASDAEFATDIAYLRKISADIRDKARVSAPPTVLYQDLSLGQRVLAEGQSIVVQVVKDPIGTKGARLSTQISIAGRMLVHLPQEKHIGVSQRIEAEAERGALRERIARLVPADEPGGFIVRTMAENASDAEFATDIAYLRKTWADIRDKARIAAPPSVLYQDLSLSQRVLRDFVNPDTSRILIDSRETFQRLRSFAEEYTPAVKPLLEHYTGERPLFDLHGVEEELQRALARRVDLKSGGYLILDQTEAMTTIDVNTGGFVGVRNFDDTIFKTNLEAAVTIARQLRLRNLGGIIIVDFIDMESEEHRKAVLEEFNKALARDHTRLTVNGFTALGLVEMTRKRTRESLAHVLCHPCPTCGGRGEVKTARTVAYEILRELLREARQFNAREYRVLAGPAVVDLFLDEESQSLAMLSDFIEKPVSLQSEPSYSPEQYDIVLM